MLYFYFYFSLSLSLSFLNIFPLLLLLLHHHHHHHLLFLRQTIPTFKIASFNSLSSSNT
ncbi:hypothetical protein BDZ91DRAFT_737859 [Kalaharituber pfeilii]|nr:hypothetical protein BDZ91DRAFT_737859 [Kalaharituber pfeilii]